MLNVSFRSWGFIVSDDFRVLNATLLQHGEPCPEFLVFALGLLAGVSDGLHPGKLSLVFSRFVNHLRGFPVQSHQLRDPVIGSRDLLGALDDRGVIQDGLGVVIDEMPLIVPQRLPVLAKERLVDHPPAGGDLRGPGLPLDLQQVLRDEEQAAHHLGAGRIIGDLLVMTQYDLRNSRLRHPVLSREFPAGDALPSLFGYDFVPVCDFSRPSTRHTPPYA